MAKYLLAWADLSEAQRKVAVDHRYQAILEGIVEYGHTYGGAIDEAVEAARIEMDRMHTPWFLGEVIHEKVGDLLMQVASSEAQDMLYRHPSFFVWISDCVLPKE